MKSKWVSIHGLQYFTASPPGFIWKGTTNLFTAYDMYVNCTGRLTVFLLSVIRVINAHGAIYNEAELQRWIAECVWFPTSLLPSENMLWEAIDLHNAKLVFRYGEVSTSYRVTFNDIGEITQFETTRAMSEEKKETWIGTVWDYEERYGVIIPTTIEVKWVIGNENYPYARFHVKTIDYKYDI